MALFSESELRAAAQALGDTDVGLTNAEIDELFQLCRIPDEFGPGTKWKRVYVNLWNKQVHDRHRKASLAFIRKAMKPERYLRDPDRFTIMLSSLNKALSFAGLAVDDTGQLHKAAPFIPFRKRNGAPRSYGLTWSFAASIQTCSRSAGPN